VREIGARYFDQEGSYTSYVVGRVIDGDYYLLVILTSRLSYVHTYTITINIITARHACTIYSAHTVPTVFLLIQ
jgi:hypothetical protein